MLPRSWTPSLLKIIVDVVLFSVVFWIAFFLRFEGDIPPEEFGRMVFWMPIVVLLKLSSFVVFGIMRPPWRHISFLDVKQIFLALLIPAIILGIARILLATPTVQLFFRATPIPFGVLAIDTMLGFLGAVGVRSVHRQLCELRLRRDHQLASRVRTLLLGAGDFGAWVAKELQTHPEIRILPIGFLDDDPVKKRQIIHRVPVLGRLDQLEDIVHDYQIEQVLITTGRLPTRTIRDIAQRVEKLNLTAKIIPQPEEVFEGKIPLSRMREVAIEDLLRREPVHLDCEAVRDIIEGKTVMVTGAGGSIGSQLCHEIVRFNPTKLLLVEKTENSLFYVERKIQAEVVESAGRSGRATGQHAAPPSANGETTSQPPTLVIPCLADICEDAVMRNLFATHRPEVVFHAAAHKHVPMMELHPHEAIKNNVLGTKMLADLAHAYDVREFVMISTDKAVNPTSVMGVSKRIAELYIQSISQTSPTRFVAVRFGNVLGSNGSVVPLFVDQIANGGPVTVTHPEMERYFMTIPEACQLVLQAASMGKGGEIFILDMGKPVKIVTLAEDLIFLSGFEPHVDIKIVFTGMRPGEKLFEELSFREEIAATTNHPRIYVGKLKGQALGGFDAIFDELKQLSSLQEADPDAIRLKLREIVPEYQCKVRADAVHSLAGPHVARNPNGSSALHEAGNS
jgi:FlaA1/EpsC-like NDP-sugar epimerase